MCALGFKELFKPSVKSGKAAGEPIHHSSQVTPTTLLLFLFPAAARLAHVSISRSLFNVGKKTSVTPSSFKKYTGTDKRKKVQTGKKVD